MTRLEELFPSAAMHVPRGLELEENALDEPGTVLGLGMLLGQLQYELRDSPHALEQFTLGVLEDIRRLGATDCKVPEAARVVLSMTMCWVPTREGMRHAQPLVTWQWLHNAFGHPVPADAGEATTDLAPLARALRDENFKDAAADALILLAPALFYVNAVAHSAQGLAERLHLPVVDICRARLPQGDDQVVEAAIHVVTYLVRHQQYEDARALGHLLERFLYKHPGHPLAGSIAVLLARQRPPITHRPTSAIARWALDTLELNPYTVHALVTELAAGMTSEEQVAFFPEVLAQLRVTAALAEQAPDAAGRARARGLLLSEGQPLVHAMLDAGRADQLMHWLSVWRGVADDDRRRGRCIVLSPGGSRAWYRPGTAPGTTDNAPLVRLTKAMNAALGRGLVTQGLSDADLTVPADGETKPEYAPEFEAALHAYLDADDLEVFARSEKAEAFVSLLSSLIPVQAMLARRQGAVLPLAVSLRQPLPDRSVKAIQLWCGDAPFAPEEAEILKTVFSYAHIRCDIVPPDEVTRKNFLAAYQNDDYDVIWVAAHGDQPVLAPDESSIVLNTHEHVPLQELAAALVPSATGRRLLVLNACHSAAANTQGFLDDHGLARSLVGPGQAVIGHLWPVSGASAAIFGALLACELADGQAYSQAFEMALRAFQGKWGELARHFSDRGIGRQVAEAMQKFRAPTLLDWGSPAFFE
ncbi:CHAT domain-containing protein [Streptomyces sp. BF23-18]|uniref:CHAT domain-containing protein n=1 Tax=Streptomyces sp. BF23-18 TaxID=3240282 RepID=UPI0034E3F291